MKLHSVQPQFRGTVRLKVDGSRPQMLKGDGYGLVQDWFNQLDEKQLHLATSVTTIGAYTGLKQFCLPSTTINRNGDTFTLSHPDFPDSSMAASARNMINAGMTGFQIA